MSETATARHTPGPWLLTDDKSMVYALHHYGWRNGQPRMVNRFSAQIDSCVFQGGSHAEAKANAHLIAAAPELLELAYAVAEHFRDTDAPLGAAARAAIAKAEGRQS